MYVKIPRFNVTGVFALSIDGVILSELRQIPDERGTVLHMLRNDSLGFAGFGECYFSEIAPGKVKAWKMHTLQTQNLAVPIGKIRLFMLDLRKNSSTQGQTLDIELHRPNNYSRVTIPPGIWYGFACISPFTALLVNCTDLPHHPSESVIAEVGDDRFPAVWSQFN